MDYACIYVPEFMVQAILRGKPTLRDQALAIIDGIPPLLRVAALNEKARQAGVQVGMTQTQASEFPFVQLRQRSPAQEATTHAVLLDCAWALSPRIEDTAMDTVVLDLTGVERLFHSSKEIARQLRQRVSDLGLEINVGVASNPDTAIHAARGFPGITLIPPGTEAERLGCLPIDVLAPPLEILETLLRWGMRTFRDLTALPTIPLSERLGQEGVRLQKLARGASLRQLVCAEPAPSFEEVTELEYPVELLEPLLFILGRLLDQLCARLEARVLATQEIRLRLELDRQPSVVGQDNSTHTKYERTLHLPVPMRDSKVFLKLLQLTLKSYPPPAPIKKVAIAAEPLRPRVAQHGLFLPLSPDPEKLEVMLARLAGIMGKENVGSPELLDTHRPGAFRMHRFNPSNVGEGSALLQEPKSFQIVQGQCRGGPLRPSRGSTRRVLPYENRGNTTMALRVFRPPMPATVEVRASRPARVFASGISGDVIAAAGPWRTSGDWWRENAWEREEWEVELSVVSCRKEENTRDGCTRLYRIHRDLLNGRWFIQGTYD
jgi:protein ImuB